MLEAFAEDEGVKWHYNSAGRAFWYLCQKCHERAWPEDKRGRAARPGVDDWLGAASGSNRRAAVRVACGDLYLTTPPPEFLPPSSPRPRTSNARTARSRTPPSSATSLRGASSVSRPQSLRCSFTRAFRPDLRVQWSDGGVWRYQVGARYADNAVACGLERRARIEVLQQEQHKAGDTECDGCGLTGGPGFLRFSSVLATNDAVLGPCNAALCSTCRSRLASRGPSCFSEPSSPDSIGGRSASRGATPSESFRHCSTRPSGKRITRAEGVQ